MAVNLPGPYEVEYQLDGWTAPIRSHLFRVNCAAIGSPVAGSLPNTIDMQKRGGGTAKLDVVANQLWEFLRLFWNNGIVCSGYTLWKYVPGTYAKDFVAAGAVTNQAASGSAGVVAAQLTQTYRSANGGIMKIVLLETNQAGDTRVALVPNTVGTPSARLAAYLLSADSFVMARDDAFPVSPLRDARGQNESVWRKVYRST
ncbi:MAG TPA: hypothetical protein V6C65_41170 [Allocoleopsis sp.]